MKFKHLKPGDFLEAYALVQDFRIRYTVNQTPYYGLLISDGETTLDARLWDINLKKDLASGVVYKMSLKINDFGVKSKRSSITFKTSRKAKLTSTNSIGLRRSKGQFWKRKLKNILKVFKTKT